MISTFPKFEALRRAASYFALALFIIFLIAQHSLVFLYYDDWGLAVLDYVGAQHGFLGQDFDFHHLMNFLRGMYLNWTGRVTALGALIYLFKLGLEYVRLYQFIVILAIVLLSLKLASDHAAVRPPVLIPITLYLALPIFALAGGLYWYTAASTYVWGIPFLLGGIWFVKRRGQFSIASGLLLAFAACFHEMMALAVIGFFLAWVFLDQLDSLGDVRRLRRDLLLFLPVFTASLLVILAPGNFKRQQGSVYPDDHFIKTVLANARSLVNLLVVNPEGHTFLLLFLLSMAILVIRFIAVRGYQRSYAITAGTGVLCLIFAWHLSITTFTLLLFLGYGALLVLLRDEVAFGRGIAALYAGALASLPILLLAPYVAGYSLLIFYFLLFPVITHALQLVPCRPPRAQMFAALAALLIMPWALSNAGSIYRGYRSNLPANTYNHYKLWTTKLDYRAGHATEQPIRLYKLPSPRFASTMPYQRPLIEKWVRKYYSLPEDIQFHWEQPRMGRI